MSSLDRTISGDVLAQHLPHDALTIDANLVAQHGRSARTLVKEGELRLTLIELAAGGNLPAHHTEGPVSIHVLKGDATFAAGGRDYSLETGDLLVVAPGVEHAAKSRSGALLLLTLVQPEKASQV